MSQAESEAVRDVAALRRAGLIDGEDEAVLEAVAARFSVAVTPQMRELIDGPATADPIAAQFVPQAAELTVLPEELTDPIADRAHSPLQGIVHRYPDRALLMPLRVCPVYCRFCFRREAVGSAAAGEGMLDESELDAALAYIAETPSLWEVVLSGGDPLLLAPRRISTILRRLEAIPHVRVVRIHSRVPVVDPMRVTDALLDALDTDRALYVAVHANHPREFAGRARESCARLARRGIPLLSQSVLLRGVNDDVGTLTALMRAFVENRIKPYYLHHGDLAVGTSHLRVSVSRGLSLLDELRGHVSGLCQPTYVIDLPGGAGKVPLGPSYLAAAGPGQWQVRDRHGRLHVIRDSV